jgi:hypothetical protein
MKKIFDPYKVRPADYRSRYPELKRIKEFEGLTAVQLITIWWYANPTSELVTSIKDDRARIEESLKRAGFTPDRSLKADLLKLNFDEKWAIAIERMAVVEPDIRDKARQMIEKLIENYEDMCDPDQYKDKDGIPDISKFVNATTKIAQELPGLITKMEEGFGVSNRSEEEDEASTGFDREYYQNAGEQ